MVIWLPRWKRKQIKAKKWLEEQETKMNSGWHRWFAWKPVVTNRKEKPFYRDSERIVWLTWLERKWYRAHEYDSFHYIYHKKGIK